MLDSSAQRSQTRNCYKWLPLDGSSDKPRNDYFYLHVMGNPVARTLSDEFRPRGTSAINFELISFARIYAVSRVVAHLGSQIRYDFVADPPINCRAFPA